MSIAGRGDRGVGNVETEDADIVAGGMTEQFLEYDGGAVVLTVEQAALRMRMGTGFRPACRAVDALGMSLCGAVEGRVSRKKNEVSFVVMALMTLVRNPLPLT
jgi:hypothetical protein